MPLPDPWLELVWQSLLEEFDYDVEDIIDADPQEIWQVVFDTIMDHADPRDLPQVPLDRPVVDEDEANQLKDEHGRFAAN